MLLTDVGDQMSWWQVSDVGDRFRMLVTDLIHWKNHQHNSHEKPILSRDMGPKNFFHCDFWKEQVEIHRTKPFKYWKIDKGKSSILYMSIPSHIPEIHNSHDRNRSGKFSFLIFSNFCCGDHCDKMHLVCSVGEFHFEFWQLPLYTHFYQVSNRKCRTLVQF